MFAIEQTSNRITRDALGNCRIVHNPSGQSIAIDAETYDDLASLLRDYSADVAATIFDQETTDALIDAGILEYDDELGICDTVDNVRDAWRENNEAARDRIAARSHYLRGVL
jgi:hypothetical protein